jgi:hypothetical protein
MSDLPVRRLHQIRIRSGRSDRGVRFRKPCGAKQQLTPSSPRLCRGAEVRARQTVPNPPAEPGANGALTGVGINDRIDDAGHRVNLRLGGRVEAQFAQRGRGHRADAHDFRSPQFGAEQFGQ